MKKRKKSEIGNAAAPAVNATPAGAAGWTFMTNHTHVLLCLYRNPERDFAWQQQFIGRRIEHEFRFVAIGYRDLCIELCANWC